MPSHPVSRFILLALTCGALAGCRCGRAGPVFGPVDPSRPLDTLVLSNGAEPKSVDPGLADESSGIELVNNLFEGLTAYAPRTLAPEPGVATRWERSDDGLRYVFHLREAKWSDGTPLTAHDFVYAWRRVLSPEFASQYAYQLWYLKGAQPFNEGREKNPETVGVRALDDRTLEVELEQPTPFFTFLTSFATYAPVPPHVVDKWGTRWTRPEHIVSNGPYRMVRWSLQNELVFERNEMYWDAANVPIRKVYALTVESDHAVMNLYRTGEVDTTAPNSSPPLSAVPMLRQYEDYGETPYLGTYLYWFNTRRAPFDNVLVRRAFALAVDKRRIVETMLHGVNPPAWSVVPDQFREITGYVPPLGPGDVWDPDAAKRLLAEAGYPAGRGLPPISLVYNQGSDAHRLVAEAVQAMWKATLGVEVQVLNMEWKVMLSEMHQGNFQIARSSWVADYPEPSTFLTLFLGDGGQNDSGWKSEAFDSTLARALAEPDQERRNALYAKAERILLDEMPVIPVYAYSKFGMANPRLGGMDPNPMDLHRWKHLYWKPAPAGGERDDG